MKVKDLDNVVISSRTIRPARNKPVNSIHGFDTETHKGKCFLIASSEGKSKWAESIDDVLQFLSRYSLRTSLNFFWNLEYDLNAILKYLDRKHLIDIYYGGKLQYGKYRIKYIPRKMFSISHSKNVVTYFDLWQYYKRSLNNAAKKYIGERKDDIDVTKFSSWKFINKHREKIQEYCIQDCKLTQKLGQRYYELADRCSINFTKPISPAWISYMYFTQNTVIPHFWNEYAQKYAYACYYGGRFETFKRGYFPNVYNYDIHSSYPYVMNDLLDINNGEWNFSRTIPKDAVYGFLRVKLRLKSNYVQPLALRENGMVIFPRFKDRQYFITLDEYNYIKDNDLGDIEVVKGIFFHPKNWVYPFRKMQYLYSLKEKYAKEKDDAKSVIKLIMNGFYGKFMQLTPYIRKARKSDPILDTFDIAGNNLFGTYVKKFRAGRMFNPIYATLITSRARLNLLKEIKDPEETVIACYTDSIHTTENNIRTSDKMGAWGLSFKGEGLYMANGIYAMRNGDDKYTKMRGFKVTNNFDLFEVLERNKDRKVIKFDKERVIKLGETLMHNKIRFLSDFNNFTGIVKELNINCDRKRIWEREMYSCSDVLKNVVNSLPLQR